jgi:hypothetical protein
MKSNRFYLACLRDNTGSCVAFHKEKGGYGTNLNEARELTREEAQKAWDGGREFDLPLCADCVDALAVMRVDFQYIPSDSVKREACNDYVCYVRSRWDGNDVLWRPEKGSPTTDFSLARRYKRPEVDKRVNWLPFDVADKAKRPTLDISDLDKRRMVQSAGLLTPGHVKRFRRRVDSGKQRFNCPKCGRINWQLNPYDFSGCSNMECEEWRPTF